MMANPILSQSGSPAQTIHYTIKEFQLIVRDAPAIPAEIQPFVGIQYRSSMDVYRAFSKEFKVSLWSPIVLKIGTGFCIVAAGSWWGGISMTPKAHGVVGGIIPEDGTNAG